MTSQPPKPESLDITAVDGRLIGVDPAGYVWIISWCGNGVYSHWVLSWTENTKLGWYVYVYPEHVERSLKDQIRAAEHKHRIYS